MIDQLLNNTFQVKISFKSLLPVLEKMLAQGSKLQRLQAEYALSLFEKNPLLAEGFSSLDECGNLRDTISELMELLFPNALTDNEIKVAINPIDRSVIYASKRFENIKETAENDLLGEMLGMHADKDITNLLSLSIILNGYYGFNTDMKVPKTVTVRAADGKESKYRMTANADFLDLSPNDNAIEITETALDDIMSNISNPESWLSYFPSQSWKLEGFMLLTLTDITLDEEIDAFKESLITIQNDSVENVNIDTHIKNIFGIEELLLGAVFVDKDHLVSGSFAKDRSLILNGKEPINLDVSGMEDMWEEMKSTEKPLVIPNLDLYTECAHNSVIYRNLQLQNIKSIAFFPIRLGDDLYSIIEIASPQKNKINPINIFKLETILPFIRSFANRSLDEMRNRINAVIQEECTSIHSAVKWRFEEEALRFLAEKRQHRHPVFQEIVFNEVYPLYGQVDIVGSSQARNKAIQSDLVELLTQTGQLLENVTKGQSLPFYEQLLFGIRSMITEVLSDFQANTEQKVSGYFERELYPVITFLKKSNHKDAVAFLKQIDHNYTLYVERKKYDETVDAINRYLSDFLEEKQEEAQTIFPHYFQKYKTDGIEHDMYVGQSIAQGKIYHESILSNLRLWQLQTVCEMEARYYAIRNQYPIDLKVASLILAYDMPMSIRYRIDEKKFDVDGAYNVRYEIIKKRIDKAHIKNTDERLTQPGKLAIVYANRNTELEYLNYVYFLKNKGYFIGEIEILELEDLQGAVGLKAIRVEINAEINSEMKTAEIHEIKV
ncbi:MAG: hypothetical protein Q4G08_05735 [Capnocytophaga sp.]|nr:hypothetical protein [Capnocytophaga sp.]